jgi:hypothetical protein
MHALRIAIIYKFLPAVNQLIKGNTLVDFYNPSNSTGNSASTNFYNINN